MPKFTIRMDVALTYEVEAADEDEAIEEAQNRYDCDDLGEDRRITETLAFCDEEEEDS